MFLEFSNNNGKKYIRVVESVRVEKNGKKVTKKVTVKNIGPASKYDDGKPEYLERLKSSFLEGKPLIKELLPYIPSEQKNFKYDIAVKRGSDYCFGQPKIFSYILIEKILEELKITQVVRSYKHFSKTTFRLLDCIRLMIYEKVLNSTLKIDTLRNNNEYFGFSIGCFNKDMIYQTLSFIHTYKNQILNRIKNSTEEFSVNDNMLYYIVDNFCFNTSKRKIISENKSQMPVNLSLFFNEYGHTISYKTISSFATVGEVISLNTSLNTVNGNRCIFVSNKDIFDSIKNYLNNKNRYIFLKKIGKEDKKEYDWVFADSDYIKVNSSLRYKSKTVERIVIDENGKRETLKEKIIVYWDKTLFENQIEEYLTVVNLLDDDFKKQMGYTQIITSEILLEDLKIINIYKNLEKKEELFLLNKGEFLRESNFLKTEEQIDAYFTVCLISSMILQMIKNRVNEFSAGEDSISEETIRDSLKKWTVDVLPNNYYRFNNIDDKYLQLIIRAFNIEVDKKLYKLGDLRTIKQTIVDFNSDLH